MALSNLNYHHLLYFWTVAKEGSFTRAALRLSLSQSALSHQVRLLEEQLGFDLVERPIRRALRLTDLGREVFVRAEQIFSLGQDLEEWLQGGARGSELQVRIGAVGSLSKNFQIQFLKSLLSQPTLQMTVRVGEIETLMVLLKNRDLDFVIANVPALPSLDPMAVSHELSRSRYVLAATPAVAKRVRKWPQDLRDEPIYRLLSPSGAHLGLERALHTSGLRDRFRGDIEDVALLRLIGLSGEGLIFLPEIGIARDLEEKRLRVVHSFRTIQESFYIISRAARVQNHRLEEILAKIIPAIKAQTSNPAVE
jgi:LysR family transcriptional activator of nhaA